MLSKSNTLLHTVIINWKTPDKR